MKRRSVISLFGSLPLSDHLFEYWVSYKLSEFDRLYTKLTESLGPISDPKKLPEEQQTITKSISQLESNLNWAFKLMPLSRSEDFSSLQKRREKLKPLKSYIDILDDLIIISNSISQHLDRKLRIPSNKEFKLEYTVEDFNTENQKVKNVRFKNKYAIDIDTQNKYVDLLEEVCHNLDLFMHFLWFRYPSDEESQIKLLNWYSQVESKNQQPPDVLSEYSSWTERPAYQIYGNNISLQNDGILLEEIRTIINPAYNLFHQISRYNSNKTLDSNFDTLLYLNNLYIPENIEKFLQEQ